MVKFITIYCDNCRKPIIQDTIYTKDFKIGEWKDLCMDCRLIQGEDIQLNINGEIRRD